MRPDPAPMTWMIAAHSALLEHVGDRGLLDVEDLAADRQQRLVVAAAGQLGGAERAVALDDEQLGALDVGRCGSRRSLAGSVEDSRAFLRRWVSLCSRALIRDFISETTFSSSRAACCLVAALGRGEPRGELLLDDPGDDGPHGVGAEHLLGLALELRLGQPHGDDRGEAGEDVVLLELVGADLEPAGVELELPAEHLEQRLLEPGQVGAALGRGDDVDEGRAPACRSRCPSAARRRPRTRARPRWGVMWPLASSTGTVSLKVPLPCSRHTSVTGGSGARNSQNSEMPPSWRKTSSASAPADRARRG